MLILPYMAQVTTWFSSWLPTVHELRDFCTECVVITWHILQDDFWTSKCVKTLNKHAEGLPWDVITIRLYQVLSWLSCLVKPDVAKPFYFCRVVILHIIQINLTQNFLNKWAEVGLHAHMTWILSFFFCGHISNPKSVLVQSIPERNCGTKFSNLQSK